MLLCHRFGRTCLHCPCIWFALISSRACQEVNILVLGANAQIMYLRGTQMFAPNPLEVNCYLKMYFTGLLFRTDLDVCTNVPINCSLFVCPLFLYSLYLTPCPPVPSPKTENSGGGGGGGGIWNLSTPGYLYYTYLLKRHGLLNVHAYWRTRERETETEREIRQKTRVSINKNEADWI